MTSWTTRPEERRDTGAIREILLAAMRDGEADLVEGLRADESAWLPDLSYVAEVPNHDVIGYGLLSRCHVDEVPALALGPMAVLPSYQGRGAGSAVIEALLAAARVRAEAVVVCLGHASYYPRFGFRPASGFGITPPVADWPDETFMALPLDGATPTGTVRYPTPWGIG